VLERAGEIIARDLTSQGRRAARTGGDGAEHEAEAVAR